MPEYPHTIDNGLGERLTFLRRVSTPEGEMIEVENEVQPKAGPPMHRHHFQRESLTVQSGRMGYQVAGKAPQEASVGESVSFAPGVVHRFWNAGDEPLRCTGVIGPPDNIEYFLGQIYASQRRTGSHRPDPFDAAFLARRYRSEFEMVGIPAFVQRWVFPVQVAIGTLIGKYRKYADAPAPVRR